MIETFNDLQDATQFIETLADEARRQNAYFKAELFKLEDNRWRVGIVYSQQMELDV